MSYPVDNEGKQYLSRSRAIEWANNRVQNAIEGCAVQMLATGQADSEEEALELATAWAAKKGIDLASAKADIEERFHVVKDSEYDRLLHEHNELVKEKMSEAKKGFAPKMSLTERAALAKQVLAEGK